MDKRTHLYPPLCHLCAKVERDEPLEVEVRVSRHARTATLRTQGFHVRNVVQSRHEGLCDPLVHRIQVEVLWGRPNLDWLNLNGIWFERIAMPNEPLCVGLNNVPVGAVIKRDDWGHSCVCGLISLLFG